MGYRVVELDGAAACGQYRRDILHTLIEVARYPGAPLARESGVARKISIVAGRIELGDFHRSTPLGISRVRLQMRRRSLRGEVLGGQGAQARLPEKIHLR